MFWRPIIRRATTLEEVETYYDIDDLGDLNEALDIQDEAERKAAAPKGK